MNNTDHARFNVTMIDTYTFAVTPGCMMVVNNVRILPAADTY